MRKLAMWLINNVPVGPLAPYIFAYAIGANSWEKTDNHALGLTRKTRASQLNC